MQCLAMRMTVEGVQALKNGKGAYWDGALLGLPAQHRRLCAHHRT